MKKIIIIFLSVFNLLATDVNDPFRGGIPLSFDKNRPADDLIYDEDGINQNITSIEAINLYYKKNSHLIRNKNNKGKKEIWNTSFLKPRMSAQYVWTHFDQTIAGKRLDDRIDLREDMIPEVDFNSIANPLIGLISISVGRENIERKTNYVFHFGKRIHNHLLTKMLLRKMGYIVPGMKRLARAKINFKNEEEKNFLIEKMQDSLAIHPKAWIEQEDKNWIIFKDIMVTKEDNSRLNFALDNYITDGLIKQHKRIYKALPIYWSLTNVPESIETFLPQAGRLDSDHYFLDYDMNLLAKFDFHRDDAIWAIRKLMDLTMKDWDEIVAGSGFPNALHGALKALLLARRDSFIPVFKDFINAKRFNPDLKKEIRGWEKETDENGYFPTYARQFNAKEQDNDFLSFSQIKNFVLSRFMTTAISLLMQKLNSIKYLNNDLEGKLKDVQTKVEANMQAYIDDPDANPLSTVVESYGIPMFGGQLIFNREIALGATLGTDNTVQLVDVIGANVYLGYLGGEMGRFKPWGRELGYDPVADKTIKQLIPIDLSGTARVSLSRTYAHVKPISNIKAAFSYPFKNAIVPFLKNKFGKYITPVLNANTPEELKKLRNEAVNNILLKIDDEMKPGESLIITDSIVIDTSAKVGIPFNVIKISTNHSVNSVVTRRIHILKTGDSSFQVYNDTANLNSVSGKYGMNLWFLPVAGINFGKKFGKAKVLYHNIDLTNPNDEERYDKLMALKNVFEKSKTKYLSTVVKPWKISYDKIRGFENQQKLLIFRRNGVNNYSEISVTDPEGNQENYLRRYKGVTVGIDYQNFSEEWLNAIIGKLFSFNTSNLNIPFTNPGNSFAGKAKNHISTFEAKLDDQKVIDESVVKVEQIWNGWSIKASKAEKILKKLQDKYQYEFFPTDILHKTKKLFMYTINMRMYVSVEGMQNVLALTEAQVKEIFQKHLNRDSILFSGKDKLSFSGFKRLIKLRQKYFKALSKNKNKKASNLAVKIVKIINNRLTIQGITKMFGSEKNFFVVTSVEGYRSGDEKSDDTLIVGNTAGRISKNILILDPEKVQYSIGERGTLQILGGPLERALLAIKVSPGEFYINWLQGRLL